MRRMRILHLGKYYPPSRGGIESVVETLCRGERPVAETQALVLNKARQTSAEVVDDVPVTRVGSLVTIGAVSVAVTLPWWLARAEADVIVLHEPNPVALLAYALARPRAPLVVWFHSEVIRPRWRYRLFYEPLLTFALRRAARVVVASPPMLDVPALAGYREKCTVIPYGVALDRHDETPAVSARAAAIRAAARAPVLLFVGRLVGYKGADVLLRALPDLEAETVIVGDGPCRPALTALARDLGLADRVRFVGETTDAELRAWYRACDLLVLPSVSRQEAFGMVQLEGMLCGHPVVSTDLQTGVSWVNQHERTGLVVRPGDVGDLRGALTRLLGDADLRHRLGAAARARVLEVFTAEQMCGSTLSLYRDVAGTALPARHRVEVAGPGAMEVGR